MNLKDDKQQNIQRQLDFSLALMGEAREAGRGGTEASGAMNGTENPASTNRLMEEVCKRENLKAGLRRGECQKAALPSHPETTVEWDLRAETGEAGRNRQAGRRGAKAWHPDGAGSIHPAGGDAGSAEAVGPDVFRIQLWVPAGTVGSASGGPGAAVHRRGPRLVR